MLIMKQILTAYNNHSRHLILDGIHSPYSGQYCPYIAKHKAREFTDTAVGCCSWGSNSQPPVVKVD